MRATRKLLEKLIQRWFLYFQVKLAKLRFLGYIMRRDDFANLTLTRHIEGKRDKKNRE